MQTLYWRFLECSLSAGTQRSTPVSGQGLSLALNMLQARFTAPGWAPTVLRSPFSCLLSRVLLAFTHQTANKAKTKYKTIKILEKVSIVSSQWKQQDLKKLLHQYKSYLLRSEASFCPCFNHAFGPFKKITLWLSTSRHCCLYKIYLILTCAHTHTF